MFDGAFVKGWDFCPGGFMSNTGAWLFDGVGVAAYRAAVLVGLRASCQCDSLYSAL